MPKLSNTASSNRPQLVRRIYDRSKLYADVVDLTLGDPDIPSPEYAKAAANKALSENKTKYTANAGIPELREAIAADVKARTGVDYALDEIAVTAGGMGALYLSSRTIFEVGDEVIILRPNWPNYTNMIQMCGAIPRYVDFLGDSLDTLCESIEAAITEKTSGIIINSPSNPTGMILPFDKICGIAALAKKHDLWVITDEVYRTIVFDDSFHSILELDGMKERTVLVDSMSKRFSMTGYRVGFVCAPRDVAIAVAALEENVNSCACQFAQYASLAALKECASDEKNVRDIFKSRMTAMAGELARSPKLKLSEPQATFYLFIDITATGMTSEEFAYGLLDAKHIAVVPGNAFGESGEGYIRIACTRSEELLVKAARAIVEYCG